MKSLSPQKKNILSFALHFLVWSVWFVVPILFSINDPQAKEPPKDLSFYIFIWIPMIFLIIQFYLNYFFLVDKLLFRKKLFWFLSINLLIILSLSFLSEFTRGVFQIVSTIQSPYPKPPKGALMGLQNILSIFAISISVAMRATSRWYITEAQRKNLENENLKSELSNLKMQLNPHFFFNTLNNIYSLIKSSPDKAQESVHGLAKLMRYHLYETNEEMVSLAGEVEFLINYIALMKIRMTPNVIIETDFIIEHPSAKIAPLLFISLIENSFKHGVSPIDESFIRITLLEKNNILSFEILNTDHPQVRDGFEETGIGLENLKKRLVLIYPEKHNFTQGYKSKYFNINVTIQL